MVLVKGAAITIPATWLLMLFWNSLGMQLSYSDTLPLGAASVAALGALVSVMSTGLNVVIAPVAPGPDDAPAPGDELVP